MDFDATLIAHGLPELRRERLATLQLNLTYRCNLACHHCHVESSPRRSETMDARTLDRVLELLAASPGIVTVDLTGGAPEMHPDFRRLVRASRALGREVIDRCNLTILLEPGYQDLPEFLASQQVRIVASLPCYSKENVERQRGRHVFDRSIAALQRLNALGYGATGSQLGLDLVFNPQGIALPGPQAELEREYRAVLDTEFGVVFDRLLTIANMPIARFARELEREGTYDAYLGLLRERFNPATAASVMCRDLVSVDFAGRLYDCDFNQALQIPAARRARTLWDLERLDQLVGERIATAPHCFGCTAGAGSSCGGALV
jgi:radical SAM/Cys-rich protein